MSGIIAISPAQKSYGSLVGTFVGIQNGVRVKKTGEGVTTLVGDEVFVDVDVRVLVRVLERVMVEVRVKVSEGVKV